MWPSYDEDDLKVVSEILKSGKVNYWTGDNCKKFEEEFSNLMKCKYSIALANGSLALTAAYKSLDLKIGDEIITTPRTFLATASSAVLLGLKTIFADVDYHSGCITAETIEPLITKKTKAISLVHIGGWPAEVEKIRELANSYNLKLVEDCSQAHGAKFKGISVGNFGDVSTWSFCQDKIISTGGEGGMLTTNSKNIFKSVLSYKDHGKNFDLLSSNQKSSSGFKWLHESIGTNMRLTEIQSAIGRNQLKKLENWNQLREKNSMILFENLKEIDCIRIPLPDMHLKHAWYRFYCYIDPKYLLTGWDRNRILFEVEKLGVKIFSGSCGEIYLEKCFQDLGYFPKERLKNAKELGETSLAILVDPTISENEQFEAAKKIRSVINQARK
tara:strand:- start:3568 stop:4725 length:1158 start_codon:yes stop_codon:yes gene_type:complete